MQPLNTPNTSVSAEQLQQWRQRLLQNIGELNSNKYKLKTDDFNQLNNYHNYALNILSNMSKIKSYEQSNQYNRNMRQVMGQAGTYVDSLSPDMKVVYNYDGSTSIMPKNRSQRAKETQGEWNRQFDEQVINGTMETLPPNGYYGMCQAKKII
jgi:hypothetical protein